MYMYILNIYVIESIEKKNQKSTIAYRNSYQTVMYCMITPLPFTKFKC